MVNMCTRSFIHSLASQAYISFAIDLVSPTLDFVTSFRLFHSNLLIVALLASINKVI